MARSRTGSSRPTWSSTCTRRGWRGACLQLAGALVAAGLLSAAVQAQEAVSPSGLGRAPSAAERADRIVGPDGADLPEGSGNSAEGAMVFARRGCSTCHGPTGEEGPSIALVGGDVTTRTNYWPIRHWPFAPSIWDYVRRVMPYDRPGILSDDEAYAVTPIALSQTSCVSTSSNLFEGSSSSGAMPRQARKRSCRLLVGDATCSRLRNAPRGRRSPYASS